MFIRDYQCKKCGEIQEKWLDSNSSENDEPCEKCGAEASELEPVLSPLGKHGSWSKWSV